MPVYRSRTRLQEAEILRTVTRFNICDPENGFFAKHDSGRVITPEFYGPVLPTIELCKKGSNEVIFKYCEVSDLTLDQISADARNYGIEDFCLKFTWRSENISVRTIIFFKDGSYTPEENHSPFVVEENNKKVREFFVSDARTELKESLTLPKNLVSYIENNIKALQR